MVTVLTPRLLTCSVAQTRSCVHIENKGDEFGALLIDVNAVNITFRHLQYMRDSLLHTATCKFTESQRAAYSSFEKRVLASLTIG